VNTTQFSAKLGVLLSLGALTLVAGCGKEEIKVYSVPKETADAAPQMASMPASSGIIASPNAPHVHWTTPDGWQQLAPTELRVGNFLVSNGDKKAEVSIIPFPGEVGTELENVNRWRRELGLPPIEENQISSETVSVGSNAGKLYDMTGPELETLAVILEKDGTSWFFKMRGDKELVSKNKPAFVTFLKSIQFEASANDEPVVASAPKSTNSKTVSDGNSSSEPRLELPANWRETPAPAMVLKSFSVGENDHEAKITVTAFPGSVGGVLKNVNRWRNQLSLEPIDESALPKVTSSIDVLGGQATLVDMSGTDGKTGKPARMIAAMVPRQDKTWFYKLMGDEATVAKEKDAFVKFVESVHY
jgi:hypothetical protein